MTIYQILALVLAGPPAVMSFTKLLAALIWKDAAFYFVNSILLMLSITVILVAFLGVRW